MSCKNAIYIVILVVIISLIIITPGISNAEKTDISTYLDDRIPELMDLYNIPGASIALIKDGKVIWSEGYGFRITAWSLVVSG